MLEQYADNFKSYYEAFPQGKIFRITFDPVLNDLKILAINQDTFNELREAFSCENQQAFFSKQYGYVAEKRIYQINKFGFFASGLIFEILNWIKIHYGSTSFVAISKNCQAYIQDILIPLKKILNGKKFEISNISDDTFRNIELKKINKPPFEFRDYQKASIESLFFKGLGRGLIEIPTSGGKSFIIANFIWNIFKNINPSYKVLILVPNTQLVEQFYKDLLDYGYIKQQLAKFTGGMKKKEKEQNNINTSKIIISNRQYIFSNKKLLPKIDVLICDECHTTIAKNTQEFIFSLNCSIKIGCSGTIPKDNWNRWTLLGMFSKIVYKENVTDLQNRGFISKLKITSLEIINREVEANRHYLFHLNSLHKYHPDEFGNSDILFNEAYNAELDFYQKQADKLYEPVINYLKNIPENILILFDRIENGKNIFNIASKILTERNISYIDGQTEVTIREDVRSSFEKTGNNILVGNVSILGTGINIKRLSTIVFLVNTKSYSRVIQSIGRALRLHETKTEANLIDVHYNMKYSNKHYNERLKMYKEIYNKNKPDKIIKFEI